MAQLRQQYPQFVERGAEIVVVGPEEPERFARQWRRENYPFVGLPDPQHKVADLYGQEVKLLKLGRLPTLLIVDRLGRVRYRHHGSSMRDIPDTNQILELLGQLSGERTEADQTATAKEAM